MCACEWVCARVCAMNIYVPVCRNKRTNTDAIHLCFLRQGLSLVKADPRLPLPQGCTGLCSKPGFLTQALGLDSGSGPCVAGASSTVALHPKASASQQHPGIVTLQLLHFLNTRHSVRLSALLPLVIKFASGHVCCPSSPELILPALCSGWSLRLF